MSNYICPFSISCEPTVHCYSSRCDLRTKDLHSPNEAARVSARTSSHVCTYSRLQTHPSLSIVFPGTGSHWHRWWRENEIQRETDTEGMAAAAADSLSLYQVLSFTHPSVHTFFPIHHTYLLHTSIHLPAEPSIPHLARLVQFITPSLHLSINALYGPWVLSYSFHLQPFIHSLHLFVNLSLKPDPASYHDLLRTY